MVVPESKKTIIPDQFIQKIKPLTLKDESWDKLKTLKFEDNLQQEIFHTLLINASYPVILSSIDSLSSRIKSMRKSIQEVAAARIYKVRNRDGVYRLADTAINDEFVFLPTDVLNDSERCSFIRKNLAALLNVARVKDSILFPLFSPFAAEMVKIIAQTHSVLIPLVAFTDAYQVMYGKALSSVGLRLKCTQLEESIHTVLDSEFRFIVKDEYVQVYFPNEIELGTELISEDDSAFGRAALLPDFVTNCFFAYKYGENVNNFSFEEKNTLRLLIDLTLKNSALFAEQNVDIVRICKMNAKLRTIFQNTPFEVTIEHLKKEGYRLLIKENGAYIFPYCPN